MKQIIIGVGGVRHMTQDGAGVESIDNGVLQLNNVSVIEALLQLTVRTKLGLETEEMEGVTQAAKLEVLKDIKDKAVLINVDTLADIKGAIQADTKLAGAPTTLILGDDIHQPTQDDQTMLNGLADQGVKIVTTDSLPTLADELSAKPVAEITTTPVPAPVPVTDEGKTNEGINGLDSLFDTDDAEGIV